MAATIVPVGDELKVISVNYSDATATAQADVYDNDVLAWLIDSAGDTPPTPVIIGNLPPVVTPTPPLTAPQWAHIEGNMILLPDIRRGDLGSTLTALATANGANRKIACHFSTDWLQAAWLRWATYNPTLVVPGSIPGSVAASVPPAGEPGQGQATEPMSTRPTGATAGRHEAGYPASNAKTPGIPDTHVKGD